MQLSSKKFVLFQKKLHPLQPNEYWFTSNGKYQKSFIHNLKFESTIKSYFYKIRTNPVFRQTEMKNF